MGLDTGTIGAMMATSAVLHLAVVFVIGRMFASMQSKIAILVFVIIASAIIQAVYMTVMQSLSCGGVKNPTGILVGWLASVGFTTFFAALPVFISGLRLTISEGYASIFGGLIGIQGHRPLMLPRDIADAKAIATAAVAVVSKEPDAAAAAASASDIASKIGLTEEQYAAQTLTEIVRGMSFMTGFAGAYGVGVGTFYAGACSSKAD